MLIIDRGKKIVEGSAQELFDPAQMVVEMETINSAGALEIIDRSRWQSFLQGQQHEKFIFRMNKTDIPVFTSEMVQSGIQILSIQRRHSLEDYFLSLTTPSQHVETFAN